MIQNMMPLHYSCNINRVNFVLMKKTGRSAHGLEARFGVCLYFGIYIAKLNGNTSRMLWNQNREHLTGFGYGISFLSLFHLYAYRMR